MSGSLARIMNPRTNKSQRKVRFPNLIRRKPVKAKQEKVVEEPADASCQTQGCGCGK
jgi:hypothetical protein